MVKKVSGYLKTTLRIIVLILLLLLGGVIFYSLNSVR